MDYIAATGAQAFDELEDIVNKIGDDFAKGLTWVKEINTKLKKAKRYFKTDYKVMLQEIIHAVKTKIAWWHSCLMQALTNESENPENPEL